MNSRIRRMLYFLHRGSNAEAGRKLAEGFSGSNSREDSEDQELGDSLCGRVCVCISQMCGRSADDRTPEGA